MRFGKLPVAAAAAAMLLLAAMPALAATPAPSPAGEAEPPLDAYIAQQMEEGAIAGVGAAIVVHGQVVWMKGYGFADLARQVPFTPDTVMNIGSISKTVTGVALMRLVQEGRLSLDADINTYLPFEVVNPHHPGVPITLRQIATHTSGISDRWAVYKHTYHYGGDSPEPLAAFLESYFVPGGAHYARENFLAAKPGAQREYSNIAAGLAGYIVELAAGEKLSEYTRREIFAPLGMANSGWFLAGMDPGKHATLYVAQNGMTIPIPLYGGTTYPDGGVRTSVADLSRLFAALLGGGEYQGARILDEETVDEMLRFHYTEADKPDNVSLAEKNSGIFWQSKYNVTRMGHGGNDPGVATEMLCSIDKDIGVVLFSNTSLSGEDAVHYVKIFLRLWQAAEAMKAANARQPRSS